MISYFRIEFDSPDGVDVSASVVDSRNCESEEFNFATLIVNDKCDQTLIQWGSEIRPCPDFKWSKRGWFANGLDFQWDLKSGSPTI